jgi:hypothetical protein
MQLVPLHLGGDFAVDDLSAAVQRAGRRRGRVGAGSTGGLHSPRGGGARGHSNSKAAPPAADAQALQLLLDGPGSDEDDEEEDDEEEGRGGGRGLHNTLSRGEFKAREQKLLWKAAKHHDT